jgi:hypothetical protein
MSSLTAQQVADISKLEQYTISRAGTVFSKDRISLEEDWRQYLLRELEGWAFPFTFEDGGTDIQVVEGKKTPVEYSISVSGEFSLSAINHPSAGFITLHLSPKIRKLYLSHPEILSIRLPLLVEYQRLFEGAALDLQETFPIQRFLAATAQPGIDWQFPMIKFVEQAYTDKAIGTVSALQLVVSPDYS